MSDNKITKMIHYDRPGMVYSTGSPVSQAMLKKSIKAKAQEIKQKNLKTLWE